MKDVECPIETDSAFARKLISAQLIIWDEVVTIHMNCIDAVDRTLQRLTSSPLPFGGKTVIFSGDFRQTLPVVKYNEFPPSYSATIKSSGVWETVTQFKLHENMRLAAALRGAKNHPNQVFATALLRLDEGKDQTTDFGIIPLDGMAVESFASTAAMCTRLTDFVYNELNTLATRSGADVIEYLSNVKKLNQDIMDSLPGELIELKFIDTPNPNGCDSLPEECLNKISITGFPDHSIMLKRGMPVVVTRNMNINGGICNGTQMLILDLSHVYIQEQLMTGPFKGRTIMLPRVKLHNKGSPSSGLSFFRYQFPIIPAYAMSINKAQGHTFSRVGVFLSTNVVLHGQLYVALSCVSNVKNLLIAKLRERSGVVNVVHRQLFTSNVHKTLAGA